MERGYRGPMLALGIESSCDETAAALVRDDGAVLADCILSQFEDHRAYGGVVPEIAARAHLDHVDRLIEAALSQADVTLDQVDLIAATGGPGLSGGVIVGVTTGKALALAAGKPFLAVNHLEGHALSARLNPGLDFPYLLLLVSGGHCQLLAVEGVGRARRLGTTIDDAAGEAFDQIAKTLGLPSPGGPARERLAQGGDAERFVLPRMLLGRKDCAFSFSGLKTAAARLAEGLKAEADRRDLAAAVQTAIARQLAERSDRAMAGYAQAHGGRDLRFVVAGGVAANAQVRATLEA